MTNRNALRTPADLIAATAGLLGFAPTDSIVVLLLHRHPTRGLGVRCAARFDITNTTEQAATFPATCNLRTADFAAAIILAICEPRHDTHAQHVLDATRDALQANGIRVLRRLHARDVTEVGQWRDADTGECGDTYPYTDSIVTAEVVHAGVTVHRSRGDVEALFGPLPPAPPAEVGEHADLFSRNVADIAAALAGQPAASPTLPTRAGILITAHPALRDAMIGLAADAPHTGAGLWTDIARRLRGRARAEALTLAASCLCLADDTVRASIALDAAYAEAQATHTPEPRLAGLLLAAIRAGIQPAQIREALLAAIEQTDSDDPLAVD